MRLNMGSMYQISLRSLVGVLVVMTPIGIVMMMYPSMLARYMWTTSLYLTVQSAILFWILVRTDGMIRAFGISLLIMISALAIEYLGVITGFPFGSYTYSDMMPPLLGGVVPLAIGFAWFNVTCSTYILVTQLGGRQFSTMVITFLTAMSVLAFDMMLEPFAAYVNGFWRWTDGAVPWQNYVSWFVLAALFSSALHFGVKGLRTKNSSVRSLAATVFFMNMLQFTVLNLTHGFWEHTLLSFLLCSLVYAVLRSRHHVR